MRESSHENGLVSTDPSKQSPRRDSSCSKPFLSSASTDLPESFLLQHANDAIRPTATNAAENGTSLDLCTTETSGSIGLLHRIPRPVFLRLLTLLGNPGIRLTRVVSHRV